MSIISQVASCLHPQNHCSMSERISSLGTLSATLGGSMTMEQSYEVLSAVPLGLFFNAFAYEDDTLTTLLCEIINKLLHPFTYEQLVSPEYKEFLLQGLTHFSPEIRYLSIEQVFKCLPSDAYINTMVQSDIFPLVLATLAFQDTRTADKTVNLLYRLSQTTAGQNAFFGPTCLAMLKQLLHVNDITSFRVYDLIIKVATSSDAAFDMCEKSGLLQKFLGELRTDDLLVKINAIELLNKIALTSSGFIFLEKANLMNDIASTLENTDDSDIAVSLVKCAILKLLGNIGGTDNNQFAALCHKYHILHHLETCLDSSNEEVLTVTISTLGRIGSLKQGLLLIANGTVMRKFFAVYEVSLGSVKSVCLQTLSNLISVNDNSKETEDLTLSVFNNIKGSPSVLNTLIKETKQPKDDVRIAVFSLMQSIALHPWGKKVMAQSTLFMDYILDRSNEHTKEGQTWKYAIIKSILTASNALELLGNDYYTLCQTYIRQGPFYRPLEASAAVQSN
ncbi:26S proteasome non-ATPase regulatory subunit 5 [Pilobolus umbonatus]|nr:26S proteasome non-ATPase regulatory subunit 5 [Pilobolus umbonatus]